MSDKKAFVFDTNFIIKNNRLDEVIENLNDTFDVYVTQISIDERIAQECRQLKEKYDNLEKISKEYDGIAKIEILQSFEDKKAYYESGMQRHYEAAFGSNIIGIPNYNDMFSKILKRANYKIPPFASAENASDKGFKDSLIWLSILEYFKESPKDVVVFVTDDKGFINQADLLCKEFTTETGKKIEIKECSYYHEILKPSLIEQKEVKKAISFDATVLRDKIETSVENLVQITVQDYFGEYYVHNTFTVNKEVDNEYIKQVCEKLDSFINENIFEKNVTASSFLELDNRIKDNKYLIDMRDIENFYSLYSDIKNQYLEYINQFYSTVANIINRNYADESIYTEDNISDLGLPF